MLSYRQNVSLYGSCMCNATCCCATPTIGRHKRQIKTNSNISRCLVHVFWLHFFCSLLWLLFHVPKCQIRGNQNQFRSFLVHDVRPWRNCLLSCRGADDPPNMLGQDQHAHSAGRGVPEREGWQRLPLHVPWRPLQWRRHDDVQTHLARGTADGGGAAVPPAYHDHIGTVPASCLQRGKKCIRSSTHDLTILIITQNSE